MSTIPPRTWSRASARCAFRCLPFLLPLALAGCHPTPLPAPPAPPRLDGGWHTLRAEHRVHISTLARGGAAPDERDMTAVVAVARPDRFRLRILGPGGITLVDVLSIAGTVDVISSMKDVGAGSTLATLLASVAGDLQAAFDLTPRPAGRRVTVESAALVVSEPGRVVHLEDFRAVGMRSYPARITVDNTRAGYRAIISAPSTTLDEELDPALFARPPPL